MIAPGVFETVLVAPASFKGTMTAVQVADAIARGLESAGVPVDRCPVADGGEGTLAALTPAFDCTLREVEVSDPLGRPVRAVYGLGEAGRGGPVAVIETAAASGLGLVASGHRDAVAASTYGTGRLLAAAAGEGARLIYLAAGGSATTDGGSGAIEAIQAAGGLGQSKLVVLCDARTRLVDAAGGGLAGGLRTAYNAELVPGGAFVLDALRFDARMRDARAVVTGEGRLDERSLSGKLVSEIATRARQGGVPCHAIVGRRELDAFGARVLDIGTIREARTPAGLEAAGRALAEVVGLPA